MVVIYWFGECPPRKENLMDRLAWICLGVVVSWLPMAYGYLWTFWGLSDIFEWMHGGTIF